MDRWDETEPAVRAEDVPELQEPKRQRRDRWDEEYDKGTDCSGGCHIMARHTLRTTVFDQSYPRAWPT